MRRLVVPVVALAIAVPLFIASHDPYRAAATGSANADIRLSRVGLNQPDGPQSRHLRTVAPGLSRISGWISAVGASVAAADFNNDGVDEACVTDPRDDTARLMHIPGAPGHFTEVTLTPPASPAPSAPMGCVPFDADEDGDQDVLVYYWGRSPVLFMNVGGRWQPTELVTPAEIWNTTVVNVADVDGDGHLDIVVGNYFPDGARVLDPKATIDSRMQMQDSMSLARNGGTNRLFLLTPRGRDLAPAAKDQSDALPADSARSWTLALGFQDLTRDGLPELYVANDFGPDQLLVNHSTPGNARFVEVRAKRTATAAKSSVLGRDSFKGMGVTFLHPGGAPDASIAVSNITSAFGLQESNFLFSPQNDVAATLNEGVAPYVDRAVALGMGRSGWSWDIKAVDLNNRGAEELVQATGFVAGTRATGHGWATLQELAMSNDGLLHRPGAWMYVRPGDDLSGHEPNRLWCRQPDGTFQDCAPIAGFADTTVTRGFAVLDVNRDGRADLLQANQWEQSSVWLNTTPDAASSVWLRLVVPASTATGTRPAVGASVTATTQGTPTQYRQLFPANGHAGVSSAEINIGLAGATQTTLSIEWRDPSGHLHTATVTVPQGHYQLLLTNEGTIKELR